MALLVYTIIEAPAAGWGGARSIAGFALALLLLGSFIRWESRGARAPMLDVALFRNPRFSAACASVTIAFFTLMGFIFVITQYFQFIKRYGPLGAGVHLLPVAVCVGIASVLGTRLAVRAGTKVIVTSGLLLVAGFYSWVATSSATTSYATIAAQMVVYGTGMGFTSAPATEAIMGAVPLAKAGVSSAVNDATRLLGGTLGVAVLGSVYASVYASDVSSSLGGLPRALSADAGSSVGAALAVAQEAARAGHAPAAHALARGAVDSFISGQRAACIVAGAVAALGALLAAVLLPAQPARDLAERRQPQAAPASVLAVAE
jgi:hypothetical protein